MRHLAAVPIFRTCSQASKCHMAIHADDTNASRSKPDDTNTANWNTNMSGKGNNTNNKSFSSSKGQKQQPAQSQHQPQVVSGWQYHQYAQSQPDRYAYIGKDEDTGEPEFVDYGPKSARR